MLGMVLLHMPTGIYGEVDGVSVTADGRALARINDHWFFADDLT